MCAAGGGGFEGGNNSYQRENVRSNSFHLSTGCCVTNSPAVLEEKKKKPACRSEQGELRLAECDRGSRKACAVIMKLWGF